MDDSEEEGVEKPIGFITHYYTQLKVAVVELSDTLSTEDTIHVKGATTDFKQKVESLQIDHAALQKADRGQEIGLKVKGHVREHDMVYKVENADTAKKLVK